MEGSDLKRGLFLALSAVFLAQLIYADAYSDADTYNSSQLIRAPEKSDNASAAIASPSADCSSKFECRHTGEKTFWFNCYYDYDSSTCRCYKGEISDCKLEKSSLTKDEWCAYQFECVKRPDGLYQFNCYFDDQCRCFVGSLSQCRAEKSVFKASELQESVKDNEPDTNGNDSNVISITGSSVANNSINQTSNNSGLFPANSPFFKAAVGFALLTSILIAFIVMKGLGEGKLEKAKKLHKRAEELHDQGREEEAHRYYELAERYRDSKEVKEV